MRFGWFARGLLLLVTIALWHSRLEGPLDLRWDASAYYVTGVALAEGRGYSMLSEPGDVAAVQYPPGLPAIVAAAVRLCGTTDAQVVAERLRWVWFALSIVLSQLAFSLARRSLPPWPALAAALIATLAFPVYEFSDLLFAELPLAVIVAAFLNLPGRAEPGRLRRAASGALVVGAFLLRTIGIALAGAWIVEAILARRFKSALVRTAVAAAPVLAWSGYVASVQHGPSYAQPAYEYQRAAYNFHNVTYAENLRLVDPFKPERGVLTTRDWLDRVATSLRALPRRLGESLASTPSMSAMVVARPLGRHDADPTVRTATRVFLASIGLLALIGAGIQAKRREWRSSIALAAALALACSTPWPQQFGRYLMPFAAPLAIGLLVALAAVAGRAAALAGPRRPLLARVRLVGAITFGAALVVLQLAITRSVFRTRAELMQVASEEAGKPRVLPFFYERSWLDFDLALDWIDAHAKPEDVLATAEAHYAWVRTGRDAVLPPFSADPAEELRLLDTVPVRYVIVDRFEYLDWVRRYALPALESAPDRWKPVFRARDGATTVFERQ